MVAGILRRHGLDRGQDGDLRAYRADRIAQVDGVLADVDLVLQRGRDIDGGVRDDQDLVIGRHIHHEDVAEAPRRAQSGFARNHGRHEFVRVQAALHQELGPTRAYQLHRPSRGLVTVRRVDDLDIPKRDLRLLGDVLDPVRRANQDGEDEALVRRGDGPGQRGCLAGVGHRRRDGFQRAASSEQFLVLAGTAIAHREVTSAAETAEAHPARPARHRNSIRESRSRRPADR